MTAPRTLLRRLLSLGVCAALIATPAAAAGADFADWLATLRQEALADGISPAVLDATLTNLQPLPEVLALDQRQPEFVQTFAQYLGRRVTPRSIANGQLQLAQQHELLERVEQRNGVPAAVLAALWGMETGYGSNLGKVPIPAALATLAYDGRRSRFFRAQLLDALHILEDGHVAADGMRGSWAGAMGHLQFMPSTFRAHAMDGDGDGSIDVWQSLPDAMFSAGNYLQHAGWQRGMPVAVEITLPSGFEWTQAQLEKRRSVGEWLSLGIVPAGAEALTVPSAAAAVVLPQGWRGPAFMTFDNFDVLMQWNRSVHYALSVAHLARRLQGGNALAHTLPDEAALSLAQMQELQRALNTLGYDAGQVDGMPGKQTATAIRAYQQDYGLPADGYASRDLYDHVTGNGKAKIATSIQK